MRDERVDGAGGVAGEQLGGDVEGVAAVGFGRVIERALAQMLVKSILGTMPQAPTMTMVPWLRV